MQFMLLRHRWIALNLSAGVCTELLRANLQLPVLGVCIGMQALAVAHGASVLHAPEPIHGRLSQIQHTGHRLFQDIPSGRPITSLKLLHCICKVPEGGPTASQCKFC